MSKIEITRDLAERLDNSHSYVRNLARAELRALLAAPPAPVACRECMGTGGIGPMETCKHCKGTGKK